MAAARFGEGATFPIIGSVVLHIVFIGLLVAGRMGPEQPAESVAARDAAAHGEAALPVDLHSFRGAHKPGRPAPDESREMTAATVPGVPDALLGASGRTIVPTEPSPTSPPGASDSTPSAVGTTPSLMRRAGQGGVSEAQPIVRAPQAAATAEPGASDLAVAAMAVSRTPLPGMPALKVQPVAPIAAAAPQRPASPKPGPADQTLIPSPETVPAPVADAPRVTVMPDVMLQTTTPGSTPGPGLSNRTTIPLDVLAVPTPPKPADTPEALPPPPPPKPAIARTVAPPPVTANPAPPNPATAKPPPKPKPRVVRPAPPPQPAAEPTPDMVVIPPEPEPVVAMPVAPAPPPPGAASPRRSTRAMDPFANHGINGEGGGGGASSAATGGSAGGSGAGGSGAGASGAGSGAGGSGAGGSGAGASGAGSGAGASGASGSGAGGS
ncbi:MAG TPA: hypothetical protein VJR58_03435, partial [Vineibacter sp.]|nr:hypothetical protein [Vineibacter sp.]